MYSIKPMPDGTALCSNGNVVGHFDDVSLAIHVAALLNRDDAERAAMEQETPGPGRTSRAALVWQGEPQP